MQTSKGKTIAKIIGYILVVIILAGIVALIYRFTNGFNEDFKTFYVEHEGKQFLSADNKTSFISGTTCRFDVKYTFDTGKTEPKEYHVKIVPNVERDFDYTVDGERYLYSKTKDLTGAFNLKKEKTYFEVTMPESVKIESVLSKVYPDKEVIVPNEASNGNPFPYALVISSYNESVVCRIRFNAHVEVTGVTLDPSEIIFTGSSEEGSLPVPPPVSPDIPEEPEPTGPRYGVWYDTLGSGSVNSIVFDCPPTAAEGETVIFTITVKNNPEYPLEVTNIRIEIPDPPYELEPNDLGNGRYSFTMPAQDVTVMVYLMPPT